MKKTAFDHLLNCRGFALLGVLTIAVLVSIFLLITLDTIGNIQKSQNGATTTVAFSNLVSEIELVLSTEDSCTSSLAGHPQTAFLGSITAPTPVPLAVYFPFSTSSIPLVQTTTERPGFTVTRLEIARTSLTVNPAGIYTGKLLIEGTRTGDRTTQFGPPIMTATIPFNFEIDGSRNITKCSTVSVGTVSCSTGLATWQGLTNLVSHIATPGPEGYTDAQFSTVYQLLPSIPSAVAAPNVTTLSPSLWGLRCQPGFMITGCTIYRGSGSSVNNTDTYTATNGCYADLDEKVNGSTIFATCCKTY